MKTITNTIYLAFALFTFACFTVFPTAQATPDPGSVGGLLNTADGSNAMPLMSAGTGNSAFGAFALSSAVSENANTAVGAGALFLNTADNNTAIGAGALLSNTIGFGNTANGTFALFSNTTGVTNAANGYQALFSNTIGSRNTAIGTGALFSNSTGVENTATGLGALGSNINGVANTANGLNALGISTSGSGNTGIGYGALSNSTTGHGNTALGDGAGNSVTTASNAICIGSPGANVDNSCFIGNISGQPAVGGDPVFVTSAGKLGTITAVSSARFKDEIKPMNKASEAILGFKPVTFRYKKEIDPNGIPQFGLVAEEVEKVNPDLVKRDREGNLQTVRYDAVNAMLLNEFLKEHRKVKKLESTISQQQKQINALAAGLERVSAQLELSRPAPQTVLNNR
jgi:Chaperone of endosialidase